MEILCVESVDSKRGSALARLIKNRAPSWTEVLVGHDTEFWVEEKGPSQC